MALDILVEFYPGHHWDVRCKGGMLLIQHLSMPAGWGMARKMGNINHDAAVFKRAVIMAAGEYLERASQIRGRYDDSPIIRVDGIPDSYIKRNNIEMGVS